MGFAHRSRGLWAKPIYPLGVRGGGYGGNVIYLTPPNEIREQEGLKSLRL